MTVVKNPKAPFHKAEVLRLEKDLSIGKAESDKEYVFSRIGGVDVDNEGNIYVLDVGDALVKVFGGQGKFLRAIGRKGQGPGETERPIFVEITRQEEVFVYDYSSFRAVFYARDGTFISQKPAGLPVLPLRLDSQGDLIGFRVLAPPPRGGRILNKYNPDFSLLMEIAKEEPGRPRVFEVGRPALYACATADDTVIWGNSERYLLHALDSTGKLVRTIEREYDPVTITSDDREKYRKKYADALQAGLELEFRDHFPAFCGIFADDEGRIIVKTYERADGAAGSFCYDVFDPEGRYEARVYLALDLGAGSVWKDDKLYVVESDEQGLPVVSRYRTFWKR